MKDTTFENRLRELFPESQVTLGSRGRFWISTSPQGLIPAVQQLREHLGIIQLAVIVPEDVRDAFLLSYVFTGSQVIILQVRVDHEQPEVPSLAQLIPGAMVYEREFYDLFGIMPLNHPDLRRQAVPEDWQPGVFPLRKDVQFDRAGNVIPKEGN